MNIVHLIHRFPPGIGGAETWCEGVVRHLAARGHGVEVLTSFTKEKVTVKEQKRDTFTLAWTTDGLDNPADAVPGFPRPFDELDRFRVLRYARDGSLWITYLHQFLGDVARKISYPSR